MLRNITRTVNRVYSAMAMTGFIFTGSSLFAMKSPVNSTISWGPALSGGLLGLIGCGVTGLISVMIFGPNSLFSALHTIDLYFGIPLFAGFIAYDTHMAIRMYKSGNPDHIGCSTQLYLDFINILIRIIEIMAKAKK